MLSRTKSRQQGSVLVEVLLTVVILGVGLTAIIQAMGGAVRGVYHTTGYTDAALLADNVMFSYLSEGFVLPNLREADNFAEPYETYRYRLRTEKIPEKESSGKLCEVSLTVSWGNPGKEKNLAVLTNLFDKTHKQ